MQIPSMWKHAWSTRIPKRSIRSPKDIRPSALQCRIGRAVLRTIIRKALAHAIPALRVWLIYAYLPRRSTEHALLRVHRHFRNARDRCQHLQDTMWTRQAGLARPKCHGGITLSLDLSNAFDTVNRRDIERGVERVSLPKDLQNLLMSWLLQVQYFITHKGLQQSTQDASGGQESSKIRVRCTIIEWVLSGGRGSIWAYTPCCVQAKFAQGPWQSSARALGYEPQCVHRWCSSSREWCEHSNRPASGRPLGCLCEKQLQRLHMGSHTPSLIINGNR